MSHRILTVDDSRTIRAIVKNAFKKFDCELFEAEDGHQGLALAAEVQPDLIILDISMPVMTGIEMLAALMRDKQLKSTPVIMLTAESGRDNVMSIVRMGVRDYIVKPFKGEQLIERVKLVLKDLRPRMDSADVRSEGEAKRVVVSGDVIVLRLPPKISRTVAGGIELQVKTEIARMKSAGTRKIIVDLSGIVHLSMTVLHLILSLAAMCMRAKISFRLAATASHAEVLKRFKETSDIPIHCSIEDALQSF